MWTDSARVGYARPVQRYATDLIEPRLPPRRAGSAGRAPPICGRYWTRSSTYCAPAANERSCSRAFHPRARSCGYFWRWWRYGTLLGLYDALLLLERPAADREAQPTAWIVDSQSVKTTESGSPRGFDAGKKINGRKRHVLVDTLGLLPRGIVHPASVQDRDELAPLLIRIRRRFPWLQLLCADGGY